MVDYDLSADNIDIAGISRLAIIPFGTVSLKNKTITTNLGNSTSGVFYDIFKNTSNSNSGVYKLKYFDTSNVNVTTSNTDFGLRLDSSGTSGHGSSTTFD